LAKPRPQALRGLTFGQAPEHFEGEGERTESKKRETKKQVGRGVAKREISFFIVLKLQKGRVHKFILIQIF
jgi:hypothetical protein